VDLGIRERPKRPKRQKAAKSRSERNIVPRM